MRIKSPKIELDGAVFSMRYDKDAMMKVVSMGGMMAGLSIGEIPEEALDALIEMFDRCITGWTGVEDEEGKPIEFSQESMELFDPLTKMAVITAYWEQQESIEEKKERP